MEQVPVRSSWLFPYAIARLGGGSYDDFARLALSGTAERLDALGVLNRQLAQVRGELCERLFTSVEDRADRDTRRLLLDAKRDAFNSRPLRRVDRINALAPELEPLLRAYAQALSEAAAVRGEALRSYERERPAAGRVLEELSAAPVLQRGLALASHALLAAHRQAADTPPARQTRDKLDRGLIKYLSRIHLKTSPFSTFSPVAPVEIGPGSASGDSVWLDGQLPPLRGDVRLNTYICNQVLTFLACDRATCRRLAVRLNPTIRESDSHVEFLVNYRNVESFQRVRMSTALRILLAAVETARRGVSVANIVAGVVERALIDAPADQLERYLYQLLDCGLLEFDHGVSEIDPLWRERLRDLLAEFVDEAPHVRLLLDALEESPGIMERFGSAGDAATRVELLRHLHRRFSDAFRHCEERGELRPMNLPAAPDASGAAAPTGTAAERRFFTHLPRTFASLPEQMVFENVGTEAPLRLPAGEMQPLADLLTALLREMRPYDIHVEERLRMREYFLRRYANAEQVPLLTFYEDYYRDEVMPGMERVRDAEVAPALPEEIERRRRKGLARWQYVVEELVDQPSLGEAATLDVTLDQLVRARLAHPLPDLGQAEYTSYAAFVQPFRQRPGTPLMATLNTVAPGFGKMYGRFLEMLPPEVDEALNAANRGMAEEPLLVENCDASFFNANVHPPLLPYAISAPGSRSTYPADRQVRVTELTVGLDPSEGVLQLTHLPTGARVFVLDLGFQVHAGRSKLYRLLDKFTLAQYSSCASLLKALNHRLDPGREVVWVRPRVVFEERWVLQRRAWLVPNAEFPRRLPGEADGAYFVRLNEWRGAHGVPAEVFVSAFSREHLDLDNLETLMSLRREDLKPQYVSFHNPFTVLLLERMLERAGSRLILEEMLPGPEQLAEFGGERFVTELLMQTYPEASRPEDETGAHMAAPALSEV